ncbi:MAG: hypothetical protein ACLSB7_17595 [Parabacteroides distasonis]
MTTVHIEDSTPEGRWLLDLIKDHKSVTVEPEKKEAKTVGAWGAALAAGAVPSKSSTQDSTPKSKKHTSNNARGYCIPTVLGKLSDLVSYLGMILNSLKKRRRLIEVSSSNLS